MCFRNDRDRYMVEIPTTPGNVLLRQLPVLNLLKIRGVAATAKTLTLDKPTFLAGYFDPARSRLPNPTVPDNAVASA